MYYPLNKIKIRETNRIELTSSIGSGIFCSSVLTFASTESSIRKKKIGNYFFKNLLPFISSVPSMIDACVTSKIPLRLRRTLTLIFDGVPFDCA